MPNYYAHKDKQVWGLNALGRIVSLWDKPDWDAKHVSYAQLEAMQKPPVKNTQYLTNPNDHLIYGIHAMELRKGELRGFDGKDWVDCTNLLYTENEIHVTPKLADEICINKGYIFWDFGSLTLMYTAYGYKVNTRKGLDMTLEEFESAYTRMQLMKARLGI